ncbi:Hpt domain-containing protein [Massilia sp. R2A-15]|uniref:Hpt domain-containing protein n=1 Tax=Massilia sp. R2A-15 TaxID=3064278 RepID=UPI0027366328|nr:Hpt domain-containing protein [Massilia sp. R2A-15]WLI91063.1 Hpt domain-containing protein [Massilia sp. R2A-15]
MIDQEFFSRLRALNDKFAAGVPATLARLGELRARFDPQAPDPGQVAELHQILHTIAGSAATFGFRTMGQQARAIEQRLRVLMAFEQVPAADWQDWLASLDQYTAWAAADPKSDDYPA